jgi:hypothetical protein
VVTGVGVTGVGVFAGAVVVTVADGLGEEDTVTVGNALAVGVAVAVGVAMTVGVALAVTGADVLGVAVTGKDVLGEADASGCCATLGAHAGYAPQPPARG